MGAFMADPAEMQVLIMPLEVDSRINDKDVVQALQTIGLSEKVSLSSAGWERHDTIVSIPWKVESGK